MRPRPLTTAQAAQVAHVNPATIRKWVSRGHLTRYRVHDGYRIHNVYLELEVLQAEKRHRENGGGSCATRHRESQ